MNSKEAESRIDFLMKWSAMLNDQRDMMQRAVTEHGQFTFLGRVVLLTFEDTGKRTNEDEKLKAVLRGE